MEPSSVNPFLPHPLVLLFALRRFVQEFTMQSPRPTQGEIAGSEIRRKGYLAMPLAAVILDYQKHRAKKLKKQGRVG
jgi:hypothetical protein